MAYKGLNTYITEMKQEQVTLINKYLNLGIPVSAMQLLIESVAKDINTIAISHMTQEKQQYETELEKEKEAEEQQKEEEHEL